MILSDLMRLLRPPHPLDNGGSDADMAYRAQLYEARVRQWHWRINNMILGLACFSLLLIIALSPSGLPMLGGIAWANGTDQKIKDVVSPLQAEILKVAEQTKEIKEQQDRKDLSDLRQKLFETRVAQCEARGKGKTEGNPYSRRMNELQDLHYILTHTYYRASDCEDL